MWLQKNLIMYKNNDKEMLLCDCESSEHVIVVFIDGIETYPMVYFHIHLKKLPWRQRLVHGIKYIFGYQSKYGAFDEFIFNKDDVHKLEKMAEYLKK